MFASLAYTQAASEHLLRSRLAHAGFNEADIDILSSEVNWLDRALASASAEWAHLAAPDAMDRSTEQRRIVNQLTAATTELRYRLGERLSGHGRATLQAYLADAKGKIRTVGSVSAGATGR